MSITLHRHRNYLSPWAELDQMSNRLGRLFGETNGLESTPWVPPVNVEETRDQLVLTAELPGMKHDQVEIELENNVLTIRGSREERREAGEERRYHVWERRTGSFQRSFSLPRTVRADAITASFQDGILTVTMPKAPEAQGRRIEIGGGATSGEVGSGN
jgi:HSP20 family protein